MPPRGCTCNYQSRRVHTKCKTNETGWRENGLNQHPPRERDHTMNMKEGNHPRNQYFLSVVLGFPIHKGIAAE